MSLAEAAVPEPTRETFAGRVKRTRLELGLSQDLFAARIGVSINTVGRWERGLGNPHPAQMRQLAQATKKPITYFTDTLLDD